MTDENTLQPEAELLNPVPEPDATADQPAVPEGDKEKPVEKTFTQAELDELIQKRIAKEQRKATRDADRRVADALRGQKPAEKPAPGRPDRTQFSDDERYIEAIAEWKADQVLETKLSERHKAEQETQRQTQHQKAVDAFNERAEDLRDVHDDFDAVVSNPALMITDEMAETIRLSENGPALAYHLGKHPSEASRIAVLSPFLQAKELGRLEARLSEPVPTKKPSAAPDPVKPVGGKSSADSDLPKDTDSIDAWMRKERDRVKRMRG